ncbi:MAG: DUF1365 domain-containing protein [Rhodobacteraceae bacterium]|nr:DUF1365 domain-containing protein [Paracoccaceae bacterium]
MTELKSAFYVGSVMHRRVRPRKHRLTYRVFSMLVDLDELTTLDRTVAGFGYNRLRPLSFYDRDHGPGRNVPLKQWVEQELRDAGVPVDGGPIRLLCYPRMFGYAFNPLSVYFCYRKSGELSAVLHQVNNTFHQRHTYLFPVGNGETEVVRQACPKEMYVSPFIDMAMTYNFRIKPPRDEIAISIHEADNDGALLFASFAGMRVPFTSGTVWRMLTTYPLMTLKVIGGIHWEALKLWIKGIPLVHRPDPPAAAVSVIQPQVRGVEPCFD